MYRLTCVFCVLSLLGMSVFAFGEETQTPPTWENAAEASILLTSGNTEVTTVGLGIGSTYRPEEWTFKGKANYLSSKTSGVKSAESYTGELRGERKILEDLSGYLSGSYLKNEFTGFKDRLAGEAGIAYALIKGGEHTLGAEAGLGMIKENLVTAVGGPTAADRTFATARIGLDYKWKFSETADFTNNFSILENLKTMSDWRFVNTAAVTAMLNDLLSLKVAFQVNYLHDNIAPKHTDTTTTIALVAKF